MRYQHLGQTPKEDPDRVLYCIQGPWWLFLVASRIRVLLTSVVVVVFRRLQWCHRTAVRLSVQPYGCQLGLPVRGFLKRLGPKDGVQQMHPELCGKTVEEVV